MATSQPNDPPVDCFEYPYEAQHNILPEYKDIFNRPLARLVASFARFGRRVIKVNENEDEKKKKKNKALVQDIDIDLIQSIVRMCEDSMQSEDFNVLISRVPPLQSSKIINRQSNLIESMDVLQRYRQVIFPCSISEDKWMIYFIATGTATIDAYMIGDVLPAEEEPLRATLQQAMVRTLQTTSLTFKRRLHIRESLKNDSVLTAYLLSKYLHLNGNYLDIDDHIIDLHKFEVFSEYLEDHDKYLGCFLLDDNPKAQRPYYIGKPKENLKRLENMGWTAIDVEGDGHCGYYAILLGLDNINKSFFTRAIKSTATRMLDSIEWQEAVLEFRRTLETQSIMLLNKIEENTENEPKWWVNIVGTKDELSKGIFNPGLSLADWFPKKKKLKTDYHMDFMWGPLVVASKFKIRIIVIMRYAAKGSKTTFSTAFFNYEAPFDSKEPESEKPHLSWKQENGVFRISDIEFKKKPTIELLFLTGDTNHFLFLRRVFCSRTPVVTSETSKSFRDLLGHPKVSNDDSTQLDQCAPIQLVVSPILDHPIPNSQPQLNEVPMANNTTQPSPNPNSQPDTNEEPLVNKAPAVAINIAAHQENPRKRKSVSGSIGMELSNNKRTRQSTIVEGRGKQLPVSVVLRGKRPAVEGKGKQTFDATVGKRGSARNASPGTNQKKNQQSLQYEIDKENKELDELYNEDSLKHQTCARMLYDSYGKYFLVRIYDFDKEKFMVARREDNVQEKYDQRLIDLARKYENMWVGNSPGDPGEGNPPPTDISTKIPIVYQQHGKPFCLMYSFASALFYCGFKLEANVLSSLAETFSEFHFEVAVERLIDLMKNLLPQIGRPTIYQRRTKSGVLRLLTMDDVLDYISPHPTLIFPLIAGTNVSHAFCVVDDLIFDSITPFALHLRKESINWIFNDRQIKISLALRFGTKVSPQGSKIEGIYNRNVVMHSDASDSIPCSYGNIFVIPPENIATEIRTMCQQYDSRFALTLSLSSALDHRGFHDEALLLASKAVELSRLGFLDILAKIKELMQTLVPSIRITEYPSYPKKKKRRRDPLSWNEVLNNITPDPTLIIPVLPKGNVPPAFCVMDDLIFHSISQCALRLHRDTLQWLFPNMDTKIHKALRFTFTLSNKV